MGKEIDVWERQGWTETDDVEMQGGKKGDVVWDESQIWVKEVKMTGLGRWDLEMKFGNGIGTGNWNREEDSREGNAISITDYQE